MLRYSDLISIGFGGLAYYYGPQYVPQLFALGGGGQTMRIIVVVGLVFLWSYLGISSSILGMAQIHDQQIM